MSDALIGSLCILASLLLIQSGMHIAVALMLLSFVGVWGIKGITVASKLLASSANTAIAQDIFGVIPAFVLMGLLVSVTGMGRDTFDVAQRFLSRLRGGLGMTTVAANAVFAACTGTSIASASVFTKVAVPEMIRHGYTPKFAVGTVAGSSILGMLIPPSLLMIIYGVLANVSIGDMFLSGVLPGILMSVAFCLCIYGLAIADRRFVYAIPDAERRAIKTPLDDLPLFAVLWKFLPIALLIGFVIGGIYLGWFTPTEAGGAGALAAFVIGLAKRELTLAKLWTVALETGRVTAAICFLLMAAQLYSQMLTMSGLPSLLGSWLKSADLGFWPILIGYLALIVVMGCFLDSLSIMLILIPFILPVMKDFGVVDLQLVWFGLITIIAVEVGLLTPPLGLSVFTVKANLGDLKISTWEIFRGAGPFTVTMVLVLVLTVAFPWLSLALIGK
jgi:tripartite ATP-independent transporter DctM subunit